MKRLLILFKTKPSYLKWGSARVAEKLGLSEKTVLSYKRTSEFKKLKENYYNLCQTKKTLLKS